MSSGGMIPFARLPVPPIRKPEPIAYDDLRAMFKKFIADLATAEATLALVKDDAVSLPIHFGLVRLDINGDGKATEDETLWKLYARLNAQVERDKIDGTDAAGFRIAFDRGDVAWLRGYCHLLMAFVRSLSGARREVAVRTHRSPVLRQAEDAVPVPEDTIRRRMNDFDVALIGDIAAFVHLLHFPVKEPARMVSALKHLEAMIALSRESWKSYLAETDDDHEWIPNPKQNTVMPGGRSPAKWSRDGSISSTKRKRSSPVRSWSRSARARQERA